MSDRSEMECDGDMYRSRADLQGEYLLGIPRLNAVALGLSIRRESHHKVSMRPRCGKDAYSPSVTGDDAEVGTCDRQDGSTVFFVGIES
jgi:hypothetical protein